QDGTPAMILHFAILLFLAVVLLTAGFFLERNGSGAKAVADRLRQIGARAPEAGGDVGRDERYSKMKWLDSALRGMNVGQHLELLLYQAGMNVRGGVLVLCIAGLAMLGYLI